MLDRQEYMRQYYQDNKDKYRQYYENQKKNPEFKKKKKERHRVWYRANKEKVDAYVDQNREKIYAQQRERLRKIKLEVLTYYSKGELCCSCCGENSLEFLSIDHINGDGARHRKEIGVSGGSSFHQWLKRNNFPEGYRVLCFNCNLARGLFGYCPHEKERLPKC